MSIDGSVTFASSVGNDFGYNCDQGVVNNTDFCKYHWDGVCHDEKPQPLSNNQEPEKTWCLEIQWRITSNMESEANICHLCGPTASHWDTIFTEDGVQSLANNPELKIQFASRPLEGPPSQASGSQANVGVPVKGSPSGATVSSVGGSSDVSSSSDPSSANGFLSSNIFSGIGPITSPYKRLSAHSC